MLGIRQIGEVRRDEKKTIEFRGAVRRIWAVFDPNEKKWVIMAEVILNGGDRKGVVTVETKKWTTMAYDEDVEERPYDILWDASGVVGLTVYVPVVYKEVDGEHFEAMECKTL